MCVDTLDIKFSASSSGGAFLSLQDIANLLASAGIDCGDIYETSGGYRATLEVFAPNGQVGVRILGERREGRDDREHAIAKMSCSPIHYSRWRDFWDVLRAMDSQGAEGWRQGRHRVIDSGYVTRIDYTCDYRARIEQLIEGLYIDHARTMLAHADLEQPYQSYQWNRGAFASYRIGQNTKIIRIYDKVFQQQQQQESLNASWETAPQPPRLRRNRTRIELKLTQRRVISRAWNNHNGMGRGDYTGALSELPSHLREISLGYVCPLRGILLNHVKHNFRNSDRGVEAQNVRHEVRMGFLIDIFQRIRAERFWSEHQRFFRLYPWRRRFQPTFVYKARMTKWLTSGLANEGASVTRDYYDPAALIADCWPMQLTYTRPRRRLTG